MLKKVAGFLICITLLLTVGFGCAKTPPANSPAYTLENSTELPSLYDDTRKSPLGQYDETTAFGIVVQTNTDGMVLEMQNKYFLFRWTDKAKRHYEGLGVKLTDEVGVQFEIKDGKLYANSVDLVTATPAQ